MSYAIESIAQSIGARRVGEYEATIDWLLTDSRSLSFPEETLFFALTTKRNSGVRYIPELYDRGVRNFVISEEEFKQVENGELRIESAMQDDDAQPILNSQLSTLNSQLLQLIDHHSSEIFFKYLRGFFKLFGGIFFYVFQLVFLLHRFILMYA